MGSILVDNPTLAQVQAATDILYHGFDVPNWRGASAMAKKEQELVIRPLGDRILVRRDSAEKVTPGGIHLPDNVQAQNKTRKGTVVAVGPGRKLEELVKTEAGGGAAWDAKRLPIDVKIGDRVYFQQWAGSEMDDEDKLLVMLREEDVLGIIEKE